MSSTLDSRPAAWTAWRRGITFFCMSLAAGGLAGCGKPAAPPAQPPPEVGVVTVTERTLPMMTELPGRLDAFRTAEVRARVTGIVLQRVFEQGAEVREGDLLFQIDPAPFEAALASAKASLAKAEAGLADNQAKAERNLALLKQKIVSEQDYQTSLAAAQQSRADVQAGKAAVETAQLNLGYASVTAPISGRIGPALVTEGALVSSTSGTLMATIQQLDPIYLDLVQSSTAVLRLKRELERGKLKSAAPGQAEVTLILEDGAVYARTGKLLFSGVAVDPTTGMITLRALIPNPDHLLLPGMFANGRLEEAVENQVIALTQRAVQRGPGGAATVLAVTPDNHVERRAVQVARAVGSDWVITAGLQPGDRIIAEGLQKVRPGMEVKPVPFTLPTETASISTGTRRD